MTEIERANSEAEHIADMVRKNVTVVEQAVREIDQITTISKKPRVSGAFYFC